MEKLTFTIHINASPEKVSNVMLTDATYREWTKVFNATSSFEGDWSKGSKMRFVGFDENGKAGGMVSMIAEHIPHEFVSIQHIGFIKDGVEDTTSDAVKQWAGAHENYTFKAIDGGTDVLVEMDSIGDYKDYFTETWPKALAVLKEIAER